VNSFVSEDDGLGLAEVILCGIATAISDGSYKDNIGKSSGFVLRGANRQLLVLGNNIVPSNPTVSKAPTLANSPAFQAFSRLLQQYARSMIYSKGVYGLD
jgi:hypothetical protein